MDKKKSPKKTVMLERRPAQAAVSPDRKKFKVEKANNFINSSAWQIRAETLHGGIHGFYFQKSMKSELVEQPYLRGLIGKLQHGTELRCDDLGLLHIATRRAEDGTELPGLPSRPNTDSWLYFIALESDVGNLRDWTSAVENRLNENDLRHDLNVFRWAPVFAVTSWGNTRELRFLSDIVIDDDVCKVVQLIHDLEKPYNRLNLTNLPINKYFRHAEDGQNILQAYIHRTFDN